MEKTFLEKAVSHGDEVSMRRIVAGVSLILISILSLAALFVQYDINVLYSLVGLCTGAIGLAQVGAKPVPPTTPKQPDTVKPNV
jgi:hypothetical protein